MNNEDLERSYLFDKLAGRLKPVMECVWDNGYTERLQTGHFSNRQVATGASYSVSIETLEEYKYRTAKDSKE